VAAKSLLVGNNNDETLVGGLNAEAVGIQNAEITSIGDRNLIGGNVSASIGAQNLGDNITSDPYTITIGASAIGVDDVLVRSNGRANTFYGDGVLSPELPTNEPADRYSYDPNDPVPSLGGNNSTWTWVKFARDPLFPGPIDQRPIERRDDVLVYTSAVLEADLEVTGPLTVVLYAASSARDTDAAPQFGASPASRSASSRVESVG
jgi:hypothetical protein